MHWLPSRGSKNHFLGKCRPCKTFQMSGECIHGVLCNFCHMPHDHSACVEESCDISEDSQNSCQSQRSSNIDLQSGICGSHLREKPKALELELSSCLSYVSAMGPRDAGQPLADSASSTILSQDNLWKDGKLGGSYRRKLELAACIDERKVEAFDEVEEDSMLVIVDARILYGEGHSMQPTIARLDARFVEEVLKGSVPEKYDD